MSLEEKIQKNAELGADIVNAVLREERPLTDLTKLAHGAIQEYNKHQATKRVGEALKFNIYRAISANRGELKKHLQKALP